MSKIKIKATIKNDSQEEIINTNALLLDNIVKYKEKDNTLVQFNYNNNVLLRENDNIKIKYYFDPTKKTEGIINIKELNSNTKIIIETKYIDRKENNIEIKYHIDNNTFLYQIKEIK